MITQLNKNITVSETSWKWLMSMKLKTKKHSIDELLKSMKLKLQELNGEKL